jgi:hypothetical protein
MAPWAWFTTRDLADQWGDGWDKQNYQWNAGLPYEDEPCEIIKVAFDCPNLYQACDPHNESFSVEEINAGAIAWLRSPSYEAERVIIPAGTSYHEFVSKIHSAGGEVYTSLKRQPEL